jgi:hypothetical protein
MVNSDRVTGRSELLLVREVRQDRSTRAAEDDAKGKPSGTYLRWTGYRRLSMSDAITPIT